MKSILHIFAVGLTLALGPMSGTAAQAATQTFNITGSYVGGQLGDVDVDFTIEHDFSTSTPSDGQETGLTVNAFRSSTLGGTPLRLGQFYRFSYDSGTDELAIGGGDPRLIEGSRTDFIFEIDDFLTAPSSLSFGADSLANTLGVTTIVATGFAVTDVTNVSAVPLPASALPLLGGLGGLVGLRRRRPAA